MARTPSARALADAERRIAGARRRCTFPVEHPTVPNWSVACDTWHADTQALEAHQRGEHGWQPLAIPAGPPAVAEAARDAERARRGFVTVPNGFGGTTTRRVGPPVTARTIRQRPPMHTPAPAPARDDFPPHRAKTDAPAITTGRITCRACSGKHNTAAEVRACYAAKGKTTAARPVTPARSPKREASLVRWVAEGYMDEPTSDVGDGGWCRRCAGTGQFITGSVNGKPTGPGGVCFRCAGKGRQTDCGAARHREVAAAIVAGTCDTTACCDRVRNGLYDTYGIRW